MKSMTRHGAPSLGGERAGLAKQSHRAGARGVAHDVTALGMQRAPACNRKSEAP